MPYGSILRRALDITWRHKILWVFGVILAVFGGASAPEGARWQSGAQFSGDSAGDLARPALGRGASRGAIIDHRHFGLLALLLGLIFLIVA